MTVKDNTITAEGLGDFFKSMGKKVARVAEKTGTNVSKYPGRAFETAANAFENL